LRRLGFGLPTALQVGPDRAILFYRGGVKGFSQLRNGAVYSSLRSECDGWPMRRIWALVDSNREFPEPTSLFQTGPFFVVEATPSYHSRFDWTRKYRTEEFYMKPWSFEEVLQAWVDSHIGAHNAYNFIAVR
jgi:hypothetical protein